jgi:hypothetical protein
MSESQKGEKIIPFSEDAANKRGREAKKRKRFYKYFNDGIERILTLWRTVPLLYKLALKIH